jgi:hypothetical protein
MAFLIPFSVWDKGEEEQYLNQSGGRGDRKEKP